MGLIPSPSDPDETALAVWDTDTLPSSPQVVTPSGKHMKFIGAYALKANKILAVARQEWTGQLGGCGEGKLVGATKTFVTKAYLTGVKQKNFEEAFASKRVKAGVSKQTQRCLELAGTASLVDMLPLDPDKVIIRRIGGFGMSTAYYLYNLKTTRPNTFLMAVPAPHRSCSMHAPASCSSSRKSILPATTTSSRY